MAKISVIVPVYNSEKYLPRCLDSLLAQTFGDFEILLIDDGSTDSSGKICRVYAERDKRVRVFHQENRGQAAARNRGIDIAANSDSRYLAFIDSDDLVLPRYFETLCEIIGDKKISSTLYSVNGSAKTVTGIFRTVSAEEYYCRGVMLPFVIWGKLFDKALFAALRFPDVRRHEDTLLVYRLLFEAGEIAVAFAPMYCYYSNPDGITASAWTEDRLIELDAMDRQREFFEHSGYEKALRHCALTEAKRMSVQISETGDVFPEANRRLKDRLEKLIKAYDLKRSDICPK